MTERPHHKVYVVRLDPKVLKKSRQFREMNPNYVEGQPCVYVGLTGKKIRKRFGEHLMGKKAGKRFVTKYGLGLMPELYKKFNPMSYEDAVVREAELAEELRKLGYAVAGGH
jgi:hypothetical protein